jgi:hypothetical protein
VGEARHTYLGEDLAGDVGEGNGGVAVGINVVEHVLDGDAHLGDLPGDLEHLFIRALELDRHCDWI